jgi:hypothetical protein
MPAIRTCALVFALLAIARDAKCGWYTPPRTVTGGHSGEGSFRVELDAPPPELAGISIEIHHTTAPQIVVSNPTGSRLEVFDGRGRPFLRIGKGTVEGDRNSVFFRSTDRPRSPTVVREMLHAEGEPLWEIASTESSWSWFDPRIAADVPVRAGEMRPWYIPVAIDGRPTMLKGVMRGGEEPLRDAATRMVSPTRLAPGVRVVLLPGEAPALLLENRSERSVTIFGDRGEPFLRIGPGGVEANAESPTWIESKRDPHERFLPLPDMRGGPRWRKMSDQPRYAWLEPRARPSEAGHSAGTAIDWSVPVVVGERATEIRGRTLVLR